MRFVLVVDLGHGSQILLQPIHINTRPLVKKMAKGISEQRTETKDKKFMLNAKIKKPISLRKFLSTKL